MNFILDIKQFANVAKINKRGVERKNLFKIKIIWPAYYTKEQKNLL